MVLCAWCDGKMDDSDGSEDWTFAYNSEGEMIKVHPECIVEIYDIWPNARKFEKKYAQVGD